jgi:hypothetical protein
VSVQGETIGAAADVAMKANVLKTTLCHLKENRIEYAVFTLLLYSLGAIDKAMAYGTGLCV